MHKHIAYRIKGAYEHIVRTNEATCQNTDWTLSVWHQTWQVHHRPLR